MDFLTIASIPDLISFSIFIASRIKSVCPLMTSKIKAQLKTWNESYGKFPVCIAITQMSFSTNPHLKGAPKRH